MLKNSYKKYVMWGITGFSVVAASVLFFFFIYRLGEVRFLLGKIMKILEPIIYGLVIAYLLGPIASFWRRKLLAVLKKRMKNVQRAEGLAKGLAIAISLLLAGFIVSGLVLLVFPRLIESIKGIIDAFPFYVEQIQGFVERAVYSSPELQAWTGEVYTRMMAHMESWISTELIPKMNVLLSGLTTGIIGVFNSLFNLLIGVIVSVYVLMSRDKFVGQGKKILYAVLRPNAANNIITILRQSNRIFGGFISGKLIDSLIIGVICFIGLYVMKTPYMVLVSVIVGVTNIIPFFGPYIGAIPSAFLILLVDWKQCIYFVIFIVILQQIDGNIIGPKILGNSTGLSAFWVVFAILLGGGLFGFAGMLLGVPVFAVIYYMIKTFVEWRLRIKKLPIASSDYCTVAYVDEGSNTLVYKEEIEEKEGIFKKIMKKEKEEIEETEETESDE